MYRGPEAFHYNKPYVMLCYVMLSGYVTSPKYPSNYPTNADCRQYIEVPVNYSVKIDIQDFILESSYDYLYVSELLIVLDSYNEKKALFAGNCTCLLLVLLLLLLYSFLFLFIRMGYCCICEVI